MDGYTGVLCQTDIDDCSVSFSSVVYDDDGYTGTASTSTAISPPYSHPPHSSPHPPCWNNGTCLQKTPGPGFTCVCAAGFTGSRCRQQVDECASSPCLGSGSSCIDLVLGYHCQCADGYTGERCQWDVRGCTSSPCRNNGTCSDTATREASSSAYGWTTDGVTGWTDSSTNSTDDVGYTSPPAGVAKLTSISLDVKWTADQTVSTRNSVDQRLEPTYAGVRRNEYVCTCPSGFTGRDCEVNRNDCFQGAYCVIRSYNINTIAVIVRDSNNTRTL